MKELQYTKENSNLGVLQIIAVFLIMLGLYTIHSGVAEYNLPIGVNRFLFEFCSLGNVGVIILALIAGYRGVGDKRPFKLKSLLSVVFQAIFYSVAIYLLCCAFGGVQFSVVDFLGSLMPLTSNAYWLVACFLILYIFAPYLNRLVDGLTRKNHLGLIIVMVVLFSVLPAVIPGLSYGDGIVLLVAYYVMGAYFQKYQDNIFAKKKNSGLILLATVGVVALLIMIKDLLGSDWMMLDRSLEYLLSMRSVVSILIAVSIFALFEQRKPTSSKAISLVASCTLGVYLIADNYYMRSAFWGDFLRTAEYVREPVLILHCLSSVAAAFAVCVVIEILRKWTLENVFSRGYDVVATKLRKHRRR